MKPHKAHLEHTAEFSSRRRALFPCDPNSNDKDLDVSPLNFEPIADVKECSNLLSNSVCDYDILGVVEDSNLYTNTPKNIKSHESPQSTPLQSCLFLSTDVTESPTCKLKTPHDTSHNNRLPKLVRKNECHSLVTQISKVRTALFPESLSPKTFYPKAEAGGDFCRKTTHQSRKMKRTRAGNQSVYLCNRRKNKGGGINKGVGHAIKKPKKPTKLSKSDLLQAAANIIDNSPLNEFLDEPQIESKTPVSESEESEPEPEPDSNKKFFKSRRHKAVVTVHENMKLHLTNGKLSLSNKRSRSRTLERANKRPKLANDFNHDQSEPFLANDTIDNIVNHLEEKENIDGDALMSPTSQMCSMTSGLAINSPMKGIDLNGILNATPKLFPVFYPGMTSAVPEQKGEGNPTVKKIKQIAKDQMLLDAGQKKFGAIQCPECKLIYSQGEPADELMHLNYHDGRQFFRFNGWKNERIVYKGNKDARVVQILPGDPKLWWKKVTEMLEVVHRDLGYFEMSSSYTYKDTQVFLYIKNRTVVGVLVANPQKIGYRLLTTQQDKGEFCSEESYPIKCGISRMWVSQICRRMGVGTILMDCLKSNFWNGSQLRHDEIALSSPTPMGKQFASRYFNNPNFLIYL